MRARLEVPKRVAFLAPMRDANSNLPPRHLLEALRQPRRPISRRGLITGLASLLAAPASLERGVPAVGQHTAQVLADWLGCQETEIAELRAAGVVT